MSIVTSINPFTEAENARFETISREVLDEKINLAHRAFLSWKEVPKPNKKALFLKLA